MTGDPAPRPRPQALLSPVDGLALIVGVVIGIGIFKVPALVAARFDDPLLILGLWPVVLFRRSGQSEMPWTPTSSIVVRGPYRFTRNPMYLQMVLVCIGCAVLLVNLWILVFTPLVLLALYIYAIRPEEEYLERKFGDAYRHYRRRVRRWI